METDRNKPEFVDPGMDEEYEFDDEETVGGKENDDLDEVGDEEEEEWEGGEIDVNEYLNGDYYEDVMENDWEE